MAQVPLGWRAKNFLTIATLTARAALWREESRGGHYRTDFSEPRENWRVHSIQQRDANEVTSRAEIS